MSIGIYKITNPKGKIYIGQSINIEDRWSKGHKYNSGTGAKLKNSFNKYGFKNHIFEIIEECDIDNLNIKENYWIENYNSYKKGLNSLSNAGISGYKDLKWKQSHHEGLIGRKGYWEGKKRPEHGEFLKQNGSGLSYTRTLEHKINRSESVKKMWEENREEIGKNISIAKKGKRLKKVICNETQIIYNSLTECSESTGISIGLICTFIKGKYSYPTLRGFTFSYA